MPSQLRAGGLSGLTAALRLAQRGYRITLYEQKSWLGGNLGSRPIGDGEYLDVYPHMYLEWYENFWTMLEEVTQEPRESRFASFSSVKQLSKKAFPRFASITDMYSPRHMIQNMFSGVGAPADMFVFGYASIDLPAEKYNPTITLDNVDVNAFLNTRPYMTKAASDAFDSFITRVWAIPSYLASAPDFRRYLEYSILKPSPAFWLPTGSAFKQVIEPLVKAVQAHGVNIVTNTEITGVTCARKRVTEIGLRTTSFDQTTGMWMPVPGTDRTEKVAQPAPGRPRGVCHGWCARRCRRVSRRWWRKRPTLPGSCGCAPRRSPIIYLFFNHQIDGHAQGAGGALRVRPVPGLHRHLPDVEGHTRLQGPDGARRLLL